jgi:zinc transport system substrate-binding protein
MSLSRTVLALAAATFVTAGCGVDASAGGSADGKVGVLAAFYPFAFVAEKVGADRVAVRNLTAPGAEPHDLELTPRQVASVIDADLLVYMKGFQPAVDAAIEQNAPEGTALDTTTVVPLEDPGTGHDHDGTEEHADEHTDSGGHAEQDPLAGDPHVWLDPTRLATIATGVADRLAELDPAGAADYRANAEALGRELSALDAQFRTGLAECTRDVFVTSHEAFGYLAQRYELEQVGISGLSPEAEPSPARVKEVQEVARAEGVDTIFYETLVSPEVAESVAGDLGLKVAVLDPLEGLEDDSPGADYLAVMRANLAALATANGCS